MGKGAGKVLTYKPLDKDPDDARRVQEIETNFQPKSMRKFDANPNARQLSDGELVVVDDGTDRTLVIRIGGTLYNVSLTAI